MVRIKLKKLFNIMIAGSIACYVLGAVFILYSMNIAALVALILGIGFFGYALIARVKDFEKRLDRRMGLR